ncbi:MAG: hypothetical protein ACR2OD_12775 [Gaiellaceae bacterium]
MVPTTETETLNPEVVAGEGELRCTTCGYAVAVANQPDTCPMCQGSDWDAVPWRPFSRDHVLARADELVDADRIARVA